MVIIASKEGQFANRVLHFAHIASAFQGQNIRVVHPYFEEFLPYFPYLKQDPQIRIVPEKGIQRVLFNLFLLFVKVLIKLRWYNLGILEVIYYDRYDQGAPVVDISADHIQKKAKKKILVLYGWLFRNASGFDQQQDYVKSSFAIDEKFVQVARHQVLEYRKNREVLVGVHIRRGDYKRFENGRWFFEDAVYLDKMQSIKAQLDQRGLSTGFVLCSNEDINLYFFRQNLQVDHKKDAFIIDFLTLSMADFIIGPPSTFSAMASLFGNVPLQFINEAGADVSLTGFKAKAGLYV